MADLKGVGGQEWSPALAQLSKENADPAAGNVDPSRPGPSTAAASKASGGSRKLDPTWLFNAALLSNPVDLSQLVTLSRSTPRVLLNQDGLLVRMVDKILNAQDARGRIDKGTRLDVLLILANCAGVDDPAAKARVQDVLGGITEWFDQYVKDEEATAEPGARSRPEPELHKAMLLLLARACNYSLRTENVLELCDGDRQLALEAVVGVLEDGECVLTEIKQRSSPGEGRRGQWEEQTTVVKHEKPLVLQMAELLLGFTRPETYFSSLDEGFYYMEAGLELPEYCIGKFAEEVEQLLAITMRTRLVESLSDAINLALFSDGQVLSSADHTAVIAVHSFFQNLYLYSAEGGNEYTAYLLMDTLMVPHLVLPYLERCVYHAAVLARKAQANREALRDFDGFADLMEVQMLVEEVSDMSLDHPELTLGIEATLRTMVICTFRAPRTRVMCQLLHKFNPTHSLLRIKSFVARHDLIFSLLLMLNINMGTFDIATRQAMGMEEDLEDSALFAFSLLHEISSVYENMSEDYQRRVLRRVEVSGAVPVARDTPSYGAVLGILWGGGAAQLSYLLKGGAGMPSALETVNLGGTMGGEAGLGEDAGGFSETVHWNASRKAAKQQAEDRVREYTQDREDEKELYLLEAEAQQRHPTAHSGTHQDIAAAMASTLSRFREQKLSLDGASVPFSDTFTGELDAAADELEVLDQMVASDLAACRHDLEELAAEVRALQQGGEGWSDGESEEESSQEEQSPLAAAAEGKGDDGPAEPVTGAKHDDKQAPLAGTSVTPPGGDADAQAKGEAARPSHDMSDAPKGRGQTRSSGGERGKRRQRKDRSADRPNRPQRSLLGDLPTLSRARMSQADVDSFVNLQLELPQRERDAMGKKQAGMRQGYIPGKAGLLSPTSCRRVSSGVDETFACAINGHMMKDPVRAPNGQVFEKATIMLWLQTRGSVCPITGDPLLAEELAPDEELRTRIMRHYIKRAFNSDKQAAPLGDMALRPAQAPTAPALQPTPLPAAPSEAPVASVSSAAAPAVPIADDLYDF